MTKLNANETQAIKAKLVRRCEEQQLKYPTTKISLDQVVSVNLPYALRNAGNQKDRLSPKNFAEYLQSKKSGWEFPDKNGIYPKL